MAYRAEIQIGVVGIGQLGTLQKSLNQVGNTVDLINKKRIDAGFNVQNINTYNAQLEKAWQNINKAAMGSKEELEAVENLVKAKQNQIAAQERLNQLIAKEEAAQRRIVATADAGVGQQGPKLPKGKGGGMTAPSGLQAPGVMDAILGGGFPMLFGGGPGAVLGGAAGGFVGGQMGGIAGMALSIGLSAVGQKLDEATAKAIALGQAIETISVDKLRESFVYVNAELDTTVRRLLEAGEAQKAQQVIAEEAARQTGVIPEVTANITKEATMLGNQWNKFLAAIGGAVSLLAGPIINALRTMIGGLTQILQLANNIASKIFKWAADGINKLLERFPFLNNLLNMFRGETESVTEEYEQQRAQLAEATDRLRENVALAAELDRLKESEVANGTLYGQLLNTELEKEAQLAVLRKDYDDKRREARTQYAGISLDAYMKELDAEEALKRKGIERTEEEKKRLLVLKEADAQRALGLAQQNAQLDIQRNLVQQQLSLVQAYYQAQTTINNIEIQSLERLRDSVTGLDTKLRITQKIYKLEVQNAKIALESSKAQISAAIELAALELKRAELKAKNLEIDLLSAAANKETTSVQLANLRAAVDAGRAAVRIASDNLRFTKAIGDQQLRAAEATYNAAVQAAKLKAQTAGAAAQAERFASAMASAGGGRKLQVGDVVARASDVPQGPNYGFKPVQGGYEITRVPAQGAFAVGGYVNRPTRALIGEAGPEYIIPRKKVSGFVENWLNGKRGDSAVPSMLDTRQSSMSAERSGASGAATATAPINIQTGPVVQMDGKRYVSVEDMEQALFSLSRTMLNSNRSAGTRRYTGVR